MVRRFLEGLRRGLSSQTEINPEWAMRKARDDENILRLLKSILLKDSNCVDIGAHVGDFITIFNTLAPDGRHVAFEPLPKFASGLRLAFPQTIIYECALSDSNGTALFNHALADPAWSGLRRQEYPHESYDEVEVFPVELKRLDDIDLPMDIGFIKMDVEGAEFEVLKGGVETISRSKPHILFEHAQIHIAHYRSSPAAIYDFLDSACDYNVYSLADISHPLARNRFLHIFELSYRSGYDKNAETNFIAGPRPVGRP